MGVKYDTRHCLSLSQRQSLQNCCMTYNTTTERNEICTTSLSFVKLTPDWAELFFRLLRLFPPFITIDTDVCEAFLSCTLPLVQFSPLCAVLSAVVCRSGWLQCYSGPPSLCVPPLLSLTQPSHPCTNVPFVMQMQAAFSAAQILNLLFRLAGCWSGSRPVVVSFYFLLQ